MYNYSRYPQEQLNGWFGRQLKRLITKVATLVDSSLSTASGGISTDIGSFAAWADQIGSGGGSFWNKGTTNDYDVILNNLQNDPRGQYEPTESETIILDAFANDLSVLIENITQQVIFFEGQAFSEMKVEGLNDILQRVALLKTYHQVNEVKGLSEAAIDLRNLLIEIMVVPILKAIDTQMQSQASYEKVGVTIAINSGTIVTELQPLLKRVYVAFSTQFQIFNLKPIITIGNDTDLDTANNTNPSDTSASNNTGNNTTPTETKGFSIKKIAIGFGVGLLLSKLLK
ncbi:hypothetical protein [Flavobacterium sp. J27]|uniref:hypothetical protein n=1 Tax=Flavobacterium sp. J27 TaxID=2060419 RepID=UPI00102FC9AD|nr:hypothetical protein [Flavobacterium sp. J27]